MFSNANAVQYIRYTAALFLGLIVGNFITVVVHRLPIMLERMWQTEPHMSLTNCRYFKRYNLWRPRSCCPSCDHPLAVWQNLPLISYILLHGRCAFCSAPISICYPVLELLSACFAAAALWRFGANWQALAAFGFAAALLALALIDAKTYLLPDLITLPLLWAGLIVNLAPVFTPLPSAVIGAVAGYVFLWLVYWIFRLFWKKEGIGYGDFKLLSALGAWLGWAALPQIVLFASITGVLFGLIRLRYRQSKDQRLPFGPFLAASGVVTLFYTSSTLPIPIDQTTLFLAKTRQLSSLHR